MLGPQARQRLVRVDPRQCDQGGDQVGVVGRYLDLPGAAREERAGDDERDVQRLLLGDVPLLVHAAMGALHVAVVGAEDDDRVLEGRARGERVEDPGDLLTDRGLQLVVELQVGLDPRLRGEDLPPLLDVGGLTGRLGREILLVVGAWATGGTSEGW